MPVNSIAENTDIRDSLALTRTIMSNERTLLSYVRTGMTFLVAGAGIFQFVTEKSYILMLVGWLLIVVGGMIFAWGVLHFLRLRNNLTLVIPQQIEMVEMNQEEIGIHSTQG
jgi:putative membrane protein